MSTIALAVPRHQTRATSKGFTLPEIMVVVAIIAIIAGIIMPNFQTAKTKTQIVTSIANLKEVATAIELYRSDKSAYPADLAGGAITAAAFGGGNQYLPATPTDGRGGSIVYFFNGYGIPAGVFEVGTTTTWDGSALQSLMNANFTSSPPATGSKYGIIYASNGVIYANGPM